MSSKQGEPCELQWQEAHCLTKRDCGNDDAGVPGHPVTLYPGTVLILQPGVERFAVDSVVGEVVADRVAELSPVAVDDAGALCLGQNPQ